jgi:3-hydroxymyristoyl/3-hydroxydecanoyl-(acyl carrier protein) dehydratase
MNFRTTIAAAKMSGPDSVSPDAASFTFCFPASDATFAGHFPTRPLLPGVFQLELARFAAELFLQQPLQLREVTKAKFLRPIIPDETVRLELKLAEKPDTIQVRASFSVTGQPAGEAILQLARAV